MHSAGAVFDESVDGVLHDVVDVELRVLAHLLEEVGRHWVAHCAQADPADVLRKVRHVERFVVRGVVEDERRCTMLDLTRRRSM